MRHLRSIFRLREKSLLRSTLLALVSLAVSIHYSGFPEVHPCPWLLIPLLIVCSAVWDTARNLQKRWNFYHGGVLLLIYVDLMILLIISFFLVAPYSGVVLK